MMTLAAMPLLEVKIIFYDKSAANDLLTVVAGI
jgi:hypothetical protein